MIRFIIYYSGFIKKSWKWKAVSKNGRIIASGRGFNTMQNARESVNTLCAHIKSDNFVITFKD